MPTCVRGSGDCQCSAHNAKVPIRVKSSMDPSGTVGIQRRFLIEFLRRLRLTETAIVNRVRSSGEFAVNAAKKRNFRFTKSDKKLSSYKAWLADMFSKGLLFSTGKNKWTDQYIFSAAKAGAEKAFRQVKALKGAPVTKDSVTDFVDSAMTSPVRRDALEFLATRTFAGVESISERAKNKLGLILAEGSANGDSVDEIVRAIRAEIKGVSRTQASVLVQTELVAAQAESQLNAFEDLGIAGVGLEAELLTAGDGQVCPRCLSLAAGGPYPIKQARGMIPVHPRCRCAWGPAFLSASR